MGKHLKWLDENILKILLGLFIIFIPLYPKFPIRLVDYTNIGFRADDLLYLVFFIVFMLQWARRKVKINRTFLLLFVLYWGAVFLSFFWGFFIQKSVPHWTVGFLHAARRFEYMSVFLFASAIITSRTLLYKYLKLIFAVVLLVMVYGLGQKLMGFPAVQTMNPEFAKGHLLQLTPEARISSTFAGHYDLAAYLVFLIPIILSFFFYQQNYLYLGLFVGALYTLLLTASRISYGSYIVSTFTFLLFNRKFKYFAVILILTGVLTYFSSDLTTRLSKTVQVRQLYVNEQTGQVIVPQKITSKELPAGTFYIETGKLKESTSSSEKQMKAQVLQQIRDDAKKSNVKLTASQEAALLASKSAQLKPVQTYVSDISFSTRLQIEWPRAIEAFLSNPILGKGPSSITEATDNDYLRWLGEFGLLATGIFFYIFFMIVKIIWTKSAKLKKERIVYLGFLFGFAGLLMNAAYIDVFEASKVAYYFWLIAGMFIGSLTMKSEDK